MTSVDRSMTLFPRDFMWGASTSAFQIEGAAHARGESIWDEFCRRPGTVRHADSPDVACDHVARMDQDVDLMASIGLQAYRFSISWPRVMPEGTGQISAQGLDVYERLVDRLLQRDIRPMATLFHWDLPLALHRRGGWMHQDSPAWFEDYADAVAARLGDRVQDWLTINEPQVVVELGYARGIHAPGLQLPLADRVTISHRLMLAHGRAVIALRRHLSPSARIGWAPVGVGAIPATDSDADLAAATRAMRSATSPTLISNTWFNDPVILGTYPQDGLDAFGHALPAGWERDLEIIAQPIDVLGVNHYYADRVRAGDDAEPVNVPWPGSTPRTAFDWPVTPEGLYHVTRFLHDRYKLPLVITENGLSTRDWVDTDGTVKDPQRIDFTSRYLRALARAVSEGVDVRGYFHWSLLDNFEWAEGYAQRFGLVHVDFETQQRIPKSSAEWYAKVIKTSGANLLPQPDIVVTDHSQMIKDA